MRNLRKIAVISLLVVAAVVPAAPAAAAPSQCVVGATMATAAPLFYPAVGPFTSGAFNFGGLITCIPDHVAIVNGQIGGWCGLANAFGVFSGRGFVADYRGGELIFSGNVVGRLSIVPDAPSGQSCLTGASRFVVSGTLTLL